MEFPQTSMQVSRDGCDCTTVGPSWVAFEKSVMLHLSCDWDLLDLLTSPEQEGKADNPNAHYHYYFWTEWLEGAMLCNLGYLEVGHYKTSHHTHPCKQSNAFPIVSGETGTLVREHCNNQKHIANVHHSPTKDHANNVGIVLDCPPKRAQSLSMWIISI